MHTQRSYKRHDARPSFRNENNNVNHDNPALTALADLLDEMVEARMSGSGYRVALDTLSRFIRTRRHTEAVPTQWVADRLGLHRNAIGQSYADLERIRFARRIPVAARGAPTRTALDGKALATVKMLLGPALKIVMPTQEHDNRPHQQPISQEAVPAATRTDDRHEIPSSVQQQQSRAGHSLDLEPPAVDHAGSSAHRSPDHDPQSSLEPERQEHPAKPTETFDAQCHADVSAKVPSVVRFEVMQGAFKVDQVQADWGLTEREVMCLMSLSPRAEPPAKAAPPKPVVASVPTAAQPALASMLWHALPSLITLEGREKAKVVVDEIAFAIAVNGLGRGDLSAGMRAALSLVREKRWATPFKFTKDWLGAVARGLPGAVACA